MIVFIIPHIDSIVIFFRYPNSEAGYGTQSETYSAPSEFSSSSGRHSRASSSSSSGCMSDGASSTCENAFDSEFPMGRLTLIKILSLMRILSKIIELIYIFQNTISLIASNNNLEARASIC